MFELHFLIVQVCKALIVFNSTEINGVSEMCLIQKNIQQIYKYRVLSMYMAGR